MWDRFRSTPAAAPGHHHHDSSTGSTSTPASTRQLQLQQEQLQQRQRLPPSSTNISSNTTSLLTNPLSNSTNTSNSWQPRSSVIAQRQRQQQQPQHRQHHQQQLRSASTDNYYYSGSGREGGYGGYNQYNTKGGPPPPRPLRDFEVPPPVQPPARQQTFPQQSSRQQLHPPSAHARHESKDSISGRPPSSVYSQPSPLHTTFAPAAREPPNVVRHQPDGFDDDDVSPPSSPELLSPGHVRNLDISPIDEEDDLAYRQPLPKMSAVSGLPSQQRSASRQGETPSPNARSNIPMMRREKRQQRDAAAGRLRASPSQDAMRETPPREQGLRPMDSKERLRQPSPVPQSLKAMDSRERLRQPTVDYSQKPGSSNGRPRGEKNPRWDPMTGEIAMNNEKSRPSQVKPLEFARGFGLGISSTASAQRGATSPNAPKSGTGMGDRVRQMGSRMGVGSGPKHQPQPEPESNTDPAAAAFTSNRPGWRGASGRTAIVEPVKDNPEVAPLKIPPRSDKRSSPRPFGGPSPSPSPSPSRGLISPGGPGIGNSDAAMSSPPISPETQVREQDQKQQIGGGGGAGKGPLLSPSGLGGTMANTIRRIIPSSQRLPSGAGAGGANATATGVSAGVSQQQGYPSPPLSSSPSHPATLAQQQSAPVNANGGANHATTTARIDADAAAETDAHAADTYRSQSPSPSSPSPPPQQSQDPLSLSSSAEPSPTASQAPIRRKQVGSGGPPSAHLHPGRGAHHQPKESWASSVYSQQTEDASHAQQQQRPSDEIAPRPTPTFDTRNLPGAGNADSPYVQPPSRFSVTTYATSAHTSTPRESLEQFDRNYYNDADAPPLPTPPKDYTMNSYLDNEPSRTKQTKGASVMDRSRPKTRNGTNNWDDENEAPVKISLSQPWMSTAGANSAGINAQNSPPRVRKEAPRGPREQASKDSRGLLGLRNDSTNTSRPASILSVDKALPAAPPELNAETTKDRVAMLNAQLQSLGNRRININKSIKQMTELMPQDNLMATPEVMRKREMEKRKVDDLQQELADVQREEHELGMKLHRAYKRLDRQADYEPTTLWVRRATG